jgi:hypothetical protein
VSAIPPGAIPLGPALLPATIITSRSFQPMQGSFVTQPTVWVEERLDDTLVITDHPVEQGATISDHAYKRPAEVTLRLGWRGESQTELQSIYQGFLQLQAESILFDLYTGKRHYFNMLVSHISVATNERTENILDGTIHCRQVILVSTTAVNVPVQNQSNPQATAGATDMGTNNLQDGKNFVVVPDALTPGT